MARDGCYPPREAAAPRANTGLPGLVPGRGRGLPAGQGGKGRVWGQAPWGHEGTRLLGPSV